MMRSKDEVKVAGIVSVGLICLFMVLPFGVSGGNLEPSGPPGPTMVTLSQLRLDCPADPANTTNLLFSWVSSQTGFDTGITISNTGLDPFGTVGQTGTCTLHFYGDNAPAIPFVTTAVAPGSVYANTTSIIAPNFQGYMIATCNFSYAHGWGFFSDLGARNLAASVQALILCTNRNANHVERLLP
jgi:hypothetical protein